MKQNLLSVISMVALAAVCSCHHNNVAEEVYSTGIEMDSIGMVGADIEAADERYAIEWEYFVTPEYWIRTSTNWLHVYRPYIELDTLTMYWDKDDQQCELMDSIQTREYRAMLGISGEYRTLLAKDSVAWNDYLKALLKYNKAQTLLIEKGTSWSVSFNSILSQAYVTRIASFMDCYEYLAGNSVKEYPYAEVSDSKIDEAYGNFADYLAIMDSDLVSIDTKERRNVVNAIHAEQKAWNKWMDIREKVGKQLDGRMGEIYRSSTNLAKRLHLIRLKNMDTDPVSRSAESCMLSYDCDDRQLEDYPGYDIVWEDSCKVWDEFWKSK